LNDQPMTSYNQSSTTKVARLGFDPGPSNYKIHSASRTSQVTKVIGTS